MQIHSFYTTDPLTGRQASEPTLIEPINLAITDLLLTIRRPKVPEAKTRPVRKRKLDESSDDDYVEDMDRETKRAKVRISTSIRSEKNSMSKGGDRSRHSKSILSRRPQGRKFWVELPSPGSVDLTAYEPFSVTMLDTIGKPRRRRATRVDFSTLSRSATPSLISDYGSTDKPLYKVGPKNSKSKKKKKSYTRIDLDNFVDGDGSTCHQCRRKDERPKMRCRRTRPNGQSCTLFYCDRCVMLRYGEKFDPSNTAWKCPRCFDICNCSICLRKLGLGYILDDDDMSAAITGIVSARAVMLKQGIEDGSVVDVRTFLCRRGILRGNDEWLNKQGKAFIGRQLTQGEKAQYEEMDHEQLMAALEASMDQQQPLRSTSDPSHDDLIIPDPSAALKSSPVVAPSLHETKRSGTRFFIGKPPPGTKLHLPKPIKRPRRRVKKRDDNPDDDSDYEPYSNQKVIRVQRTRSVAISYVPHLMIEEEISVPNLVTNAPSLRISSPTIAQVESPMETPPSPPMHSMFDSYSSSLSSKFDISLSDLLESTIPSSSQLPASQEPTLSPTATTLSSKRDLTLYADDVSLISATSITPTWGHCESTHGGGQEQYQYTMGSAGPSEPAVFRPGSNPHVTLYNGPPGSDDDWFTPEFGTSSTTSARLA